MEIIKLKDEFIKLGQALKAAGLVETGAEAKDVIQDGLHPTMSLGCGSWGNNSISENLTYKHLMNTTRLAYYHDCTIPELDEVWKL